MTDDPVTAGSTPASWYCPLCGLRYPAAGWCDAQHAPAQLEPLPAHDDASASTPQPEAEPQQPVTAEPVAASPSPLQEIRDAAAAINRALDTIDTLGA